MMTGPGAVAWGIGIRLSASCQVMLLGSFAADEDLDRRSRFSRRSWLKSLELDSGELRSDPLSFVEDRDLVAPWSTTRLVATRAAQRDPDVILRCIDREEADSRLEATDGRDALKLVRGRPATSSRSAASSMAAEGRE